MLFGSRMHWYRKVTVMFEDLYHSDDPDLSRNSETRELLDAQCEHINEDGPRCKFSGTLAQVGVHKYYTHKQGNPAKALTFTNSCPHCGEVLASIKSAKEHINRAWNKGRSVPYKGPRPFGPNVEGVVELFGCRL